MKTYPVSFIIIGIWIGGFEKLLGATRSYGKLSGVQTVKLLEIKLWTAISEKIWSINCFLPLWTLEFE